MVILTLPRVSGLCRGCPCIEGCWPGVISPREGSASRPSTGSSEGAGGRWLGLCTSRWTRRASGFLAGQGRRRDSRLLCQSESCEPTWRGPFPCGSPLKCLSASGRPSWVNLLQKTGVVSLAGRRYRRGVLGARVSSAGGTGGPFHAWHCHVVGCITRSPPR